MQHNLSSKLAPSGVLRSMSTLLNSTMACSRQVLRLTLSGSVKLALDLVLDVRPVEQIHDGCQAWLSLTLGSVLGLVRRRLRTFGPPE